MSQFEIYRCFNHGINAMLKVLSKGRDDEKGMMLQRRGLDGWNTQGNNKKYQNLKQIKFTQYIGSL